MENFIHISFTFPTALYTGLLAIVTIYWLFSVIGFFDLDVLDVDLDADGESDFSLLGSFLNKFKLEGVPVTISLSLIILLSWLLCFLMVYHFSTQINAEWLRVVLGIWIIILTPLLTAPLVAIIITPLKPLFKGHNAQSSQDIIGKTAIVRSSKVTANFGEAKFNDGGAGLILKIRCEHVNTLQRGNSVTLKKYNAGQHTYLVTAKQ